MTPTPEESVRVHVDGHELVLKRLEKALYPDGTTKGEVLNYYARIAPVLLPHLADRPVTRIRWPDGTTSSPFFEKNMPSYAPDWIRVVEVPTPGSSRGAESLTFPLIENTAALTWLVNLAALEFHVPQWTVDDEGWYPPNRLVIDLDPGPPAHLAECARVAVMIRDRLSDDGLSAVPVSSGSKGLQLYVPIAASQDADAVSKYAKRLAESLARDHPDLVVAKMTKTLRSGKVFLDWSQNNPAKTTISPYSLRGRDRPYVAAPRTWDELEDPHVVHLTADEVLDRVAEHGDLAQALLEEGPELPI